MSDDSIEDENATPILPPSPYLRRRGEHLNQPELTDPDQISALAEMRKLVDELLEKKQYDAQKRDWCDEACLRRYLRARNWKVSDSFKLVRFERFALLLH